MKLVLIMKKQDPQHCYKYSNKYYNRNELLRIAANDFAKKASKLSSIVELIIFGSIPRNKPDPKDVDLAVIIKNYDDIELLAKYARQINKFYHGWEVFLFSSPMSLENNLENISETKSEYNLTYLGRICQKKECPGFSIECRQNCKANPKIKYIKQIPKFLFKNTIFFKSKFEVLYFSGPESIFLLEQKEYKDSPNDKKKENFE